jgi:hypothetical protein
VSAKSPYTNRYSTRVVLRARELKLAGWSSPKIAELLESELGLRPSAAIIRNWCSPRSEKLLAQDRARHRLSYRRRNPTRPNPRLSEDWKNERMAMLLERELSPEDIGQVALVWWGEELTGEEVRKRLGINVGTRRAA